MKRNKYETTSRYSRTKSQKKKENTRLQVETLEQNHRKKNKIPDSRLRPLNEFVEKDKKIRDSRLRLPNIIVEIVNRDSELKLSNGIVKRMK